MTWLLLSERQYNHELYYNFSEAVYLEGLFSRSGDLKLVEKPQPLTLAPHDFCNIKANVKVASTENGILFGNIGKA